jgi:formiminotetrahydrofolate cyclodeaminase
MTRDRRAATEVRDAADGRSSAPTPDSLETYLTALASAEPAPGGGSAAAVAGALGAALVAMVCRVTAARDPGAASLAGRADEIDAVRRRLTTLAADDARAYAAVIAARRAPAPERAEAVQASLRRATEVPVELGDATADILAVCADVAASARASTLGDLHVAGLLAHASLRAAVATARVNLAGITDAEVAGEIARRVDSLGAESELALRHLEAVLAERASRVA